MHRSLLGCVALLVSCVRPSDKVAADTGVEVVFDVDGDGFTVDEGDCDDADGNVAPGASERCNGVDDDCDDQVDEGTLLEVYADTDGDGFGDGSAPLASCEIPGGYVAVGTDCDDTRVDVFPAAQEACDEVDNDCDGNVDEGVGVEAWADADGDGFGDADVPLPRCASDSEGVGDATDCDDRDPDVSPAGFETCDERDEDCDGVVDEGVTTTWWADLDGDGWGGGALTQEACVEPTGYVGNAGDCDDASAYVSPSGVEVCNRVDDDCDTLVDSGAVDARVWHADADGDGRGDASRDVAACDAPTGTVSSGDDCDDTRADVSPASAERCDGADNDCDGLTDESDVADAPIWFLDYDADGFGGTRFTARACVAPAGYVATGEDCDDTSAGVSPSASETCDGLDEDCDGVVDDGVATSTWYVDRDGDGWGAAGTATTTCSAPSGYLARAGDCDDVDGTVSPSATETCDGVDENCDGVVDEGTDDADGDGTCDAFDTEACDGLDNDGDGLGDEGLTCSYRLVRSDLSSGLCVDDDIYVNVNGVRVYNDPNTYNAECIHVISFTARPGDTVDLWAIDSVGGCRRVSDVYIVNVAGSVGQYAASGYSNTCGHGASSSPFWSRAFTVPGLF